MRQIFFPALSAASLAVLLAGCMGTGGTATDMVTASTATRGLTQATEPPSAADRALSCAAVTTRLDNLYTRYAQIEKEQRSRQQTASLVNGVFDMGASMLGASAIMGAGSVQGVQNVAMATNYGRSALSGVMSAESSTQQLQDINDAMPIAQRAAQLEKVKFEKGC